MNKVEACREILRTLQEWDAYLLEKSGLPGPRANLELAQAAAAEGDEALFTRFLAYGPDAAPVNSPYEFLPFCGVLGCGRLIAQGNRAVFGTLRSFASDPRWRIREAVAMALQNAGEADLDGLIAEMQSWARGSWLEKRAAAAALAEPKLLQQDDQSLRILDLLDEITRSIPGSNDRSGEDFRILRKSMGYCWSVVVAALPDTGKKRIEHWFACPDRDVIWIMRENLKKKRLFKMDAGWVRAWQGALSG